MDIIPVLDILDNKVRDNAIALSEFADDIAIKMGFDIENQSVDNFSGIYNVEYFTNKNVDFLYGSVKKYGIMYGYKPWMIKWSFGFYTSHSVGFFIKLIKHKEVGNYNLNFLSSDLDFFYKMIVKYKLLGISTKKEEVLGEFRAGGFSSKVNYITHLRDLNNNPNKFSKSFYDSNLSEKTDILNSIQSGSDSEIRNIYLKIKSSVATSYFRSEVGATQVLKYNGPSIVLGQYKGCIPFSEVGKSWAI